MGGASFHGSHLLHGALALANAECHDRHHPRTSAATTLQLDPTAWRRLSPGTRWIERFIRCTNRIPRLCRSADVVAGDQTLSRTPLPLLVDRTGGHHGRFSRLRPVPLLLLLGTDASADVFPHWGMGP